MPVRRTVQYLSADNGVPRCTERLHVCNANKQSRLTLFDITPAAVECLSIALVWASTNASAAVLP